MFDLDVNTLIKAESLHLKHILIDHCGAVRSQNDENCVNVQIFMDLTVACKRE